MGGGVFDSPIASEKSGVTFDVTGAQTFRSTATDGDPTMLNGVERAGSNSAVDVIPTVTSSVRGLMTPDMLSQLSYTYARIDQRVPTTWLNSMSTNTSASAFGAGISARYLSSTAPNKPAGTDHALFSLAYSDVWYYQMAGDWRTDNLYVRGSNSNATNPRPWRKVWLDGDKITNAVWNDYAELFERGCDTEPGDLIALDLSADKEQYILADKTNNRVVGVHTDEYGFLIGGEQQPEATDYLEYNLPRFIPVGLVGRCHVKVKGTCKHGDYLVPSDTPGVAEVYNENVDNVLTIFGIACEDKTSEDIERTRVYIK